MTQIISYRQIEDVEGFRPQNGMYFKPKNNNYLIVLMSVRDDAPYQDEISEDGKIFKKGDFISFEPGSKHSSHTINGCLVLVFMRGINQPL